MSKATHSKRPSSKEKVNADDDVIPKYTSVDVPATVKKSAKMSNSSIECNRCYALPTWKHYPKMDDWCDENCKLGNCPPCRCYCGCPDIEFVNPCHSKGEKAGPQLEMWCWRECCEGDCPVDRCQCSDSIQDHTMSMYSVQKQFFIAGLLYTHNIDQNETLKLLEKMAKHPGTPPPPVTKLRMVSAGTYAIPIPTTVNRLIRKSKNKNKSKHTAKGKSESDDKHEDDTKRKGPHASNIDEVILELDMPRNHTVSQIKIYAQTNHQRRRRPKGRHNHNAKGRLVAMEKSDTNSTKIKYHTLPPPPPTLPAFLKRFKQSKFKLSKQNTDGQDDVSNKQTKNREDDINDDRKSTLHVDDTIHTKNDANSQRPSDDKHKHSNRHSQNQNVKEMKHSQMPPPISRHNTKTRNQHQHKMPKREHITTSIHTEFPDDDDLPPPPPPVELFRASIKALPSHSNAKEAVEKFSKSSSQVAKSIHKSHKVVPDNYDDKDLRKNKNDKKNKPQLDNNEQNKNNHKSHFSSHFDDIPPPPVTPESPAKVEHDSIPPPPRPLPRALNRQTPPAKVERKIFMPSVFVSAGNHTHRKSQDKEKESSNQKEILNTNDWKNEKVHFEVKDIDSNPLANGIPLPQHSGLGDDISILDDSIIEGTESGELTLTHPWDTLNITGLPVNATSEHQEHIIDISLVNLTNLILRKSDDDTDKKNKAVSSKEGGAPEQPVKSTNKTQTTSALNTTAKVKSAGRVKILFNITNGHENENTTKQNEIDEVKSIENPWLKNTINLFKDEIEMIEQNVLQFEKEMAAAASASKLAKERNTTRVQASKGNLDASQANKSSSQVNPKSVNTEKDSQSKKKSSNNQDSLSNLFGGNDNKPEQSKSDSDLPNLFGDSKETTRPTDLSSLFADNNEKNVPSKPDGDLNSLFGNNNKIEDNKILNVLSKETDLSSLFGGRNSQVTDSDFSRTEDRRIKLPEKGMEIPKSKNDGMTTESKNNHDKENTKDKTSEKVETKTTTTDDDDSENESNTKQKSLPKSLTINYLLQFSRKIDIMKKRKIQTTTPNPQTNSVDKPENDDKQNMIESSELADLFAELNDDTKEKFKRHPSLERFRENGLHIFKTLFYAPKMKRSEIENGKLPESAPQNTVLLDVHLMNDIMELFRRFVGNMHVIVVE